MKKIILLLLVCLVLLVSGCEEEIIDGARNKTIILGCGENEILRDGKCLRGFSYQELENICDYVAKKEWNMDNPDCDYISFSYKIEGDDLSCDCINCLEWVKVPTIKKEYSYREGYTRCGNHNYSTIIYFKVILTKELFNLIENE